MKKLILGTLLLGVLLVSCNEKNNFSGKYYVYNLDVKTDSLEIFSFEFKNDSIASVRFLELPDTTFDYFYILHKDSVEFHNLTPSSIAEIDSLNSASVLTDFCVSRLAIQLRFKSHSYSPSSQSNFESRTEAFIKNQHEIFAQREQERIEQEKLLELKHSLKNNFKEECDDFTNTCWILPKSRPRTKNRTYAYLYFEKNDSVATNLRFVVQYAAEDWLFIKYMIFNIDGTNYDFFPRKMRTDHYVTIWEWCDESAIGHDSLLLALSTAKEVKIRYVGTQYHSDKPLPSSQLKSIQETYLYYKACGGKFE